MTKPEDIPQRVWDEARSAMVQAFSAASAGKRVTDHETIARAIMAAEQREREACAQYLNDRANEIRSAGTASAIGMSRVFVTEATAILNRGENQGD